VDAADRPRRPSPLPGRRPGAVGPTSALWPARSGAANDNNAPFAWRLRRMVIVVVLAAGFAGVVWRLIQ
jgi:hypothetical protein